MPATMLLLSLACLVTIALPGCSGCQEDTATKAKREAEEDLEAKRKKVKDEEEAKKKNWRKPRTISLSTCCGPSPTNTLRVGG